MWSDDDDYFSYSPYYFDSDMADSDDGHYFDDDDYCGYSSGEDYSGVMLASRRARAQAEASDDASTAENLSAPNYQVFSLQDLCCRFIALKFPFAFVEHRSPPIPDQLQLKIIEFSFPEDEEMIRKYAEFSRSNVDFCSAKRMLENGNVKDLNQIGGCTVIPVISPTTISPKSEYYLPHLKTLLLAHVCREMADTCTFYLQCIGHSQGHPRTFSQSETYPETKN